MIESAALRSLGKELFEAERSARSVEPLTGRYPEMSHAEAYGVQDAYAELRRTRGDVLVGYKVGATNVAIQNYFGVDQPDFGHLFDAMQIGDGGEVSLARLIQPRIEPELAFRLGTPLRGPGVTGADVLAASSEVLSCFEIIDSRIKDWRIRITDTIADNGSSALFVLGSALPAGALLDQVEVRVSKGSEEIASGRGAAVYGHPAASAAWLINTLGALGVGLETGHILLSGSFTTAIGVAAGDRFRADFAGGANVTCRFTT